MIKAGYYEDVITVEDGLLFRTVIAHWAATRRRDGGCHAVYRIDENGKEYCRALMCSMYCGYYIDEDDLKKRKWFDVYSSIDHFKLGHYDQLRSFGKTDAERICSVHPDFKYVVQKAGEMPVAKMFNILIAWKKNHNVELLVGANLDYLALNKSFAKLTKPKQKAVLNFIRENSEAFVNKWSLAKINFVMNKKGSSRDFDAWQKFRPLGNVVDYRWFKKYGPDLVLYSVYLDYMRRAVTCGHDMKDPYWKYPKDIRRAHDKVMREYKRVQEALKIARAKELERREKERRAAFGILSEKYAGCTMEHSGLVVSVPDSIDSIRKQAEKLHQCLVTDGYIDRMLAGKCCLVFITDRKGKPIATAEILANGKTGQFYGDERGRIHDKMTPNSTCQLCLEAYRAKFLRRLKKVMKEVA